jgi:hypothetical protein
MSSPIDLFNDIDITDNIDGMQLVDIDLEGIDQSSKEDAITLIENLSRFYYDKDFMQRNPNFKKRVDADLESLRILIKMRKSDEIAHDNLMKAIANNSSNASLYRSLAEIQKTILSITSKMGDIITGLNNMMKNYQLELNFSEQENVNQDISPSNDTYRGSKEFINMMNNQSKESELLFESEEE